MRPPSHYLLFVLLALASLLSVMQFSMISITLPDIKDDLDAPFSQVGWVITVYMLAQSVALPAMGKVNDRLGPRTLFMGGLTIFALASLAGALAPNVWALIIARGIQGLAGGSLMPATMAIIGHVFASDRARAIGIMSSLGPAGTIVGPNLGGAILEHLGWRWTLAINVPAGLLIVAAAFLLIGRSVGQREAQIDFLTLSLLSLALTALIISLTELGRDSPNPIIVATGFLVAPIGTAAFLRRESRASDPLLDRSVLKRREFAFVYALAFLYGVIIFGSFSFIPFYAEEAYGMSTGDNTILLTARATTMIATSALASLLLPRTGYRKPIVFGLLSMAVVLAFLSQGLQEPEIGGIQLPNLLYLGILVALTGGTFGIVGPGAMNAGIDLAPDRIAAIAGLRSTFMFLGGTIGSAIIVLLSSRATSEADGLELSFAGLAVLCCLTALLVRGIPEMVRSAAKVSDGQAAVATDGQALAFSSEDRE